MATSCFCIVAPMAKALFPALFWVFSKINKFNNLMCTQHPKCAFDKV